MKHHHAVAGRFPQAAAVESRSSRPLKVADDCLRAVVDMHMLDTNELRASVPQRFEAVFAQMRANSEPAVKIELLENDLPAIPAIKEFTLKREAFPLPEE
jgi:hypothetical protein